MSDSQGPAADTSKRIFRDAALERLNSPEQLDQRIGVIPPAMRLLAASTAVIIVAALAWAVFGSVPTRVIARGVLIADKEGNYAIAPISSGLVLEMFVKTGDYVDAGAGIASIEQKLLSAQIDNAMVQIDRLEANLAQLKSDKAAQVRYSDETAKSLLGDVAPLLARIELVPAKQNPSGFAWWSGTGPPYKITTGSVVTVDTVVEQVRPISLVIPALRKLLSLEG
jgi:multidrug efflux pump subunit AcrA (membrane-fusion protein)